MFLAARSEVRPLIEWLEGQPPTRSAMTGHDAQLVAEVTAWALTRVVGVPSDYLRTAAQHAVQGVTRWDDPGRASAVLRSIADVF